jgi:hypothetical protein
MPLITQNTQNTQPIFPVLPILGISSLTGATGLTTRSNITGVAGLVQLCTTSNFGTRIDNITVKMKGQNAATSVFIWVYNGTTSYLYDEIVFATSSTTAGNTINSAVVSKNYSTFVLPPTMSLYVSETVTADANIFAFGGQF